MTLEGDRIVTADEMARIEKIAFEQGASPEKFMDDAGTSILEQVDTFITSHNLEKKVTLLVGKGNNGGDALNVGYKLLAKGYTVSAYFLFPPSECSALSQKQLETYQKQGGTLTDTLPADGILLDGLLGTGFQGKTEGALAQLIEQVNSSKLPILSIDIPSGVNGNTGETPGPAINATQTIYLALPKLGFFINEGWNHTGELTFADFGLSENLKHQAERFGFLLNESDIAHLLPPIKRRQHKYEAGYVLAIAGSPGMSGAAILATHAALRSGAGIVRLFHPIGMEDEFYSAPAEIITEPWDLKDKRRFQQESKRARALILGPGIGRTHEMHKMLKSLLPKITLPTVIDADALFHLAYNSSWPLPEQTILTPHRQEMRRLLVTDIIDELQLLQLTQEYSIKKQVTVVLKGAPTWIFSPEQPPLLIARGDPGMATAGTGDVLTGIIAALLAQNLAPREAAALGVYLHALAGEAAAFDRTSPSLIASDLIEHLSDAFHHLKNR